jgi:hypothetical protein
MVTCILPIWLYCLVPICRSAPWCYVKLILIIVFFLLLYLPHAGWIILSIGCLHDFNLALSQAKLILALHSHLGYSRNRAFDFGLYWVGFNLSKSITLCYCLWLIAYWSKYSCLSQCYKYEQLWSSSVERLLSFSGLTLFALASNILH